MQLLGFEYDVIPSETEENCSFTEPADYVQALSALKASDVAGRLGNGFLVIGADTIVVLDDKILGKPKDSEDAFRILSGLSGRRHEVYTGITLIDTDNGRKHSFYERTEVEFYPLSDEEIRAYIATGDPFDKAGGYGVQSKGAYLVKAVYGDFYNVVGLPVAKLYRELKAFSGEE